MKAWINTSRILERAKHQTQIINSWHHPSKAIYSFLREKNVSGDWIDDKKESWVLNSDLIDDKQREFLI